jgi:hypothetical protein
MRARTATRKLASRTLHFAHRRARIGDAHAAPFTFDLRDPPAMPPQRSHSQLRTATAARGRCASVLGMSDV